MYCLVNSSKISFVLLYITQNVKTHCTPKQARHAILTSYLQNLFRPAGGWEQCRLQQYTLRPSLHQPLQQRRWLQPKQPHRLVVVHTKIRTPHEMNCRFPMNLFLHASFSRSDIWLIGISSYLSLDFIENLINQLNLVGIREQLLACQRKQKYISESRTDLYLQFRFRDVSFDDAWIYNSICIGLGLRLSTLNLA